MRTIIWIIIGLLWLGIAAYFALPYISSSTSSQANVNKNLLTIWQNYANDQQTDVSQLPGRDGNAEYTRILGDYMNTYSKLNNELTRQKNLLIVSTQPRSLASPQSIDVSLEKVAEYDKTVNTVHDQLEANIRSMAEKISRVDREGLLFDVVSIGQSVDAQQAQRDNKVKLYLGVSQYVKAILEFAKSRAGYFQLQADGSIAFTTPTDQAYYQQLVDGLNKYSKQIDDLNAQDMDQVRKLISELSKHLN